MEYVYASLLLHEAKQEINETNVSKVLEAAGIKADSARVKALVASLKEVNIEEAIKKAIVMPTAVATAETVKKEEKKHEEEEAKSEISAAEGLGTLFG